MQPNSHLTRWVADQVGPNARFRFRGWPHGVSRVWEVAVPEGARFFLRECTQSRKWHQEKLCHERWLTASAALSAHTATLVAACSEPSTALLFTARDGIGAEEALSEGVWDQATKETVFHTAGSFLANLHRLPFDDRDPLPLQRALQERLVATVERARPFVDASELAWAVKAFDGGRVFRGIARVPCHRDYQPRNWLVAERGSRVRWSAIDFEHARPDLWLVDLLKLWDRWWIDDPDLESAFFAGYGSSLDDEDRLRLETLGILHGLMTMVWSHEHESAEYLAHGRKVWARVREIHGG